MSIQELEHEVSVLEAQLERKRADLREARIAVIVEPCIESAAGGPFSLPAGIQKGFNPREVRRYMLLRGYVKRQVRGHSGKKWVKQDD